MSLADGVTCKSFRGATGGTEYFLAVRPAGRGNLDEQILEIEQRYEQAQRSLRLDGGTCIFRRLFVSDVINQAGAIRSNSLCRSESGDPVAVSLVEQPPLPGLKIAMLAYHIANGGPLEKRFVTPHSVLVEKKRQPK